MKNNEGKYKPTLIYKSFIEALANVRQFGVDKHGNKEDWRTTNSILHYDACLRHIYAALDNEELDKESGLLHLAHAACNLMFLIEEKCTKMK